MLTKTQNVYCSRHQCSKGRCDAGPALKHHCFTVSCLLRGGGSVIRLCQCDDSRYLPIISERDILRINLDFTTNLAKSWFLSGWCYLCQGRRKTSVRGLSSVSSVFRRYLRRDNRHSQVGSKPEKFSGSKFRGSCNTAEVKNSNCLLER